jgi:hypothetical protein
MTIEEAVSLLNEAVDYTGPNPKLFRRIIDALEAHDHINWIWVDDATQEAVLIQPETVRMSVERVVFNDGKIGWWAKYKNSRINAYDTEEKAKKACLEAVKTVAKTYEKLSVR